jgi:hypothetical protein
MSDSRDGAVLPEPAGPMEVAGCWFRRPNRSGIRLHLQIDRPPMLRLATSIGDSHRICGTGYQNTSLRLWLSFRESAGLVRSLLEPIWISSFGVVERSVSKQNVPLTNVRSRAKKSSECYGYVSDKAGVQSNIPPSPKHGVSPRGFPRRLGLDASIVRSVPAENAAIQGFWK